MNRSLRAALVAVALTATLAGCGGKAHKATRSTAAANTPAPAAVSPRSSFVVYAKAKQARFINHADDRARGDRLNSFNTDTLQPPSNANSGPKGTRAGDNAIVSLTLYADRNLTRVIGSAIYSCTFNFGQEAVCDGQFQFGSGSIIALGPAKLDGREIVLAVTGGTGRYEGAHGQVTSTSSGSIKKTQIFRFDLV